MDSKSPNELSPDDILADEWDWQIEEDVASGQLDSPLRRAEEHHKAERCTPIPGRDA